MVILINLSTETFKIDDGERMAQMVISKHEQAEWLEVNKLEVTERGVDGLVTGQNDYT